MSSLGKERNEIGAQSGSRSKQNVPLVTHGEADARRSRVVREALERIGRHESSNWRAVLESRPEGGIKVEIR